MIVALGVEYSTWSVTIFKRVEFLFKKIMLYFISWVVNTYKIKSICYLIIKLNDIFVWILVTMLSTRILIDPNRGAHG